MGSRRSRLALGAAALAAAVWASTAVGASFHVLIRHTPNMTKTNRTARTIDGIVIHATEGHFVGSVRWLMQARSHGSAHFVVSRRGQIVQLVPVTDVAWHAGDAWWNLHSIGIEHEGWTKRGGFTEAEYRASAELVAYLAHRWGIPLDRQHVIGHSEVPDPRWPGHFGGIDGHRDPGPHWKWAHYMSLVRYYAKHRVLPHFVHRMKLHDTPAPASAPAAAAGHADRSVVEPGAQIRGSAMWWSGIDASFTRRKHIQRVAFFVDGKLRYVDHTWPFGFNRNAGWNSWTVPNGHHLLVARAYGRHHYRLRTSIPVRVVNPPLQLGVDGVASDGAVSGTVDLGVTPSSGIERVTLSVDGRPVSRDSSAPYGLLWDSTGAEEGPHTLVLTTHDRYGHRASERIPVVVANAPSFPAALSSDLIERDLHATAFALAD
jgi:N-acetyl-anhydromuramyl-L-alanine amidase AmpD